MLIKARDIARWPTALEPGELNPTVPRCAMRRTMIFLSATTTSRMCPGSALPWPGHAADACSIAKCACARPISAIMHVMSVSSARQEAILSPGQKSVGEMNRPSSTSPSRVQERTALSRFHC